MSVAGKVSGVGTDRCSEMVKGLPLYGVLGSFASFVVQSPLGFAGGFAFGVLTGSISQITGAATEKSHSDPSSFVKISGFATQFFATIGAVYGLLLTAGYQITFQDTVVLGFASIGIALIPALGLLAVAKLRGY